MARILVADDDPLYLQVFHEGMTTMGHDVTAVSSGRQVLDTLTAQRFDIVFLDLVMADGGAITVLHDLRDAQPDLPVVIITGRPELADSPLFQNGLRLAQAKFRKTASLGELHDVVGRLVPPSQET